MFKFKGISSEDMQVVIEEEEHFIARAAQRYEVTEIEGRDGAIFDELGYSYVERPIYVQCLNIDKIDDILSWLNGEGEFEYKGRKTIARFYSQLEPQRSACIRIIDTTFIRDPFWSKSDDEFEIVKNRKDKNITGESIDLNDSAEYKFKKFGISGNSWQATRSGKNKFDISKATKASGSCSFKNNGDSIDITANYIEGYISANIDITDLFKEGETIYAKANFVASSSNTGAYRIQWGEDTGLAKGDIVLTSSTSDSVKSGVLPTKPEGATKLLLYLYGNVEGTVAIGDTVTYSKIMLSNQPITDYEEYGAMPSPEFPSRVRNCGDNVNLFYLQNENVPNQTWFSIDENQLLKIKQGTSVAPTPIPIDIDLNVGDTVTISAYCVSGKYTTGEISVGLYHNGSDKAWEGQVTLPKGISLKNKTYTTTITVTNTVNTFMPFIYGNPSIEEDIKLYFKVEQGSKASPYSPYNCSNVNITVCNGNLFNIDEIANIDNWVTNKTTSEHPYCYYEFNLKPNTVYTFSRADNSSADNIYASFSNTYGVFDSNHSLIHPSNGSLSLDKVSFTTDKDGIIYLNLYNAKVILDTFIALLKDAQLEEGSVATEYITHQEQTITFPLAEGQKLMLGDYLAEDGIHHKRKQVILDGSYDESWSNQGGEYDTDKRMLFSVKVASVKADTPNRKGICNYFINSTQSVQNKLVDTTAFNFNPTAQYSNYIYFKIERNALDTEDVAGWKAWLAEHPITVEYELAEEEIEPYRAVQQEVWNEIKELYSYKNVTHIYSTDEVSPVFEVTYIKETNEKILNAGNIQSRPILRLEKTISDSVELTINNIRFKYNFNGDKYVEIDCEKKTIKYENLNRSRQIEIGYEFPKLEIGNNNIIMHTGDCIIQAKRKDRWL